jgi:hypothetical protein
VACVESQAYDPLLWCRCYALYVVDDYLWKHCCMLVGLVATYYVLARLYLCLLGSLLNFPLSS